MSRFCLDSNVLIQAKNGPYPFEIFPAFWSWLGGQMDSGSVYSSAFVYEELIYYDDALSAWIKARRDCFVEPDETIQEKYAEVVNRVQQSDCASANIEKFLQGADPWVIAHALVSGDTLVTHEKRAGAGSKKVKIPNVCDEFGGVDCIDTYQLLKRLEARL
jgi:predicted nucleic acid-binding protein